MQTQNGYIKFEDEKGEEKIVYLNDDGSFALNGYKMCITPIEENQDSKHSTKNMLDLKDRLSKKLSTLKEAKQES